MKDLKTQAISDVITTLYFKDTCLFKHFNYLSLLNKILKTLVYCSLFLSSYLLNLVALKFIFILFLL